MLPCCTEVARSLAGAWRVMDEGERALRSFDVTVGGLARSFGAAALTLPALVALIAAERLRHGLSNEAGLLDAVGPLAVVLATLLVTYCLAPAVVVALAWPVARSARGTGFLVAWNWSAVIVALICGAPAALFAAGLAPGPLALVMLAAFAVIVLRLRYRLIRCALGLGGPPAGALALLVLGLEVGAAAAVAALTA